MIYFFILVALILISYFNDNVYVNYLLLLCILSALFSLLYIIYNYIKIKIDIDVLSEYTSERDDIKVVINNCNLINRPTIIVIFELYNKQLKRVEEKYYMSFKSDEDSIYLPVSNCGDLEVRINKIGISGLFGLLVLFKKYNKKHDIKVYPRPISEIEYKSKHITIKSNGEPTNRKGEDYSEIYEIRPFKEGDDLRHIHPALSQKFDEYMIKVGSENQSDLLLYEMPKTTSFYGVIKELRKVSQIYKDNCDESTKYFCIKYKYSWHIILNKRSLYGFYDMVYGDNLDE